MDLAQAVEASELYAPTPSPPPVHIPASEKRPEPIEPAALAVAVAHRLDAVKADLFKGLAHPARIRVLEALVDADNVPVATLLVHTGLEASNLSQHLAVLRNHNLVVAERRGSQVFYQLAYPEVADLMVVAKTLLISILETTHRNLTSTVSAVAISSTLAEANPSESGTLRAVAYPTPLPVPPAGTTYDRAAPLAAAPLAAAPLPVPSAEA
ncbi:DNA-binding transcriptional ArsR family regulator [Glaciihabitans tibetensis]|uniref:DNA-binding transcriptional ArsR family regulator n=1 Tax=Glaciihabitans tibetensis TaxID=1266600 RepID=A0A2T0VG24_9MICO|nr:DNA-binding transcriptional ArsR family regulator [Glaciihabitans tibetensis]